jgi:hypothetical protein
LKAAHISKVRNSEARKNSIHSGFEWARLSRAVNAELKHSGFSHCGTLSTLRFLRHPLQSCCNPASYSFPALFDIEHTERVEAAILPFRQ